MAAHRSSHPPPIPAEFMGKDRRVSPTAAGTHDGCFEPVVVLPTVPDFYLMSTIMRPSRFRRHATLVILLATGLQLGCQGALPVTDGFPRQQGLRGKSKHEVVACAGTPLQEREEGPLTTLRYYKEAPLLEESMVSSKSSRPTVHHGCWATVLLQNQRVDQVRYRFVPSSVDASNDCEAIFANCP